jgi:hypothetical protein
VTCPVVVVRRGDSYSTQNRKIAKEVSDDIFLIIVIIIIIKVVKDLAILL